MKRKFVLIAALVAALAVVFIGCPYPTNGGGESTSGNNSGIIGDNKDDNKDGQITPPLVRSVEVTFSQAWSGFDLLDSFFNFEEGDIIEAKGKIIAVGGASPEFVFNDKPGDWGAPLFQKTGITAGTEWNFNKPLTAGMITNIAAGSPKAIRIQGNNVTASTLKVSFQQIKITRGSEVKLDLAAHLETLSVGNSDIGQILPGAKGFQKAGNVTAKVIEE